MTPNRILAAALILAAPGLAMAQSQGPALDESPQYGEVYRATTLIGTEIHITPDDLEAGRPMSSDDADEWEQVGEIGDLLVGVDGTLDAVVIDVGGFLGVGEKEVAIAWEGLRPVHQPDNMEEWFLGVSMTREELEAAPEVAREPAD